MRVLAVTSEWATPEHPEGGVFIARQIDWIRRAGVQVDVEPFRSAKNPLNYLRIRRRVRDRLRQARYDVLHAHFGQAGFAVLGLHRPLVVTFHGSDLEGIVGPSGRYTPRGKILIRLSRIVARAADEVIVVARSLARRLPPDVAFSVIPMTADPEVFHPGPQDEARRQLGLPSDKKLVLFAGRPEVTRKRFGLARQAVDLCRHTHDVELITISGLPPSGVATYMRACDALLLTSRHEGAPTVVKEALACRLPVVSVDVGDVRETVEHVSGCFVTSEDPEAISGGLIEVFAGPGRLDGSERAEVLDQAKQAAKVIAAYERSLESRAAREAP